MPDLRQCRAVFRSLLYLLLRTARVHELADIQDDTYRLVADISGLRRLGYVPGVPLDEGIADLMEELGERPELPMGATIFRPGQKAEE